MFIVSAGGSYQGQGQLHKNDYDYDYNYTVITQGDYNNDYREKT